jgi:hypothetical protein
MNSIHDMLQVINYSYRARYLVSLNSIRTDSLEPKASQLQQISRQRQTARQRKTAVYYEKLRDIARNCETLQETSRHCEKPGDIMRIRDIARNCETWRDIGKHCEKLRETTI